MPELGQLAAIVVVAALAIGGFLAFRSGDDSPSASAAEPATDTVPTSTTRPRLTAAPDVLGQRMDLVDIETWLNTDVTGGGEEILDSGVTIVQFWTFGCHNCTATLPYLQDIYAEYGDDGLEIIGVHAPEFDYERDIDNVRNAAADLGVTWPVAIDNSKTNFQDWQEGRTNYWPRTYVIDADGNIRFDHIGEGAYDDLEATVAYLLEHPGA